MQHLPWVLLFSEFLDMRVSQHQAQPCKAPAIICVVYRLRRVPLNRRLAACNFSRSCWRELQDVVSDYDDFGVGQGSLQKPIAEKQQVFGHVGSAELPKHMITSSFVCRRWLLQLCSGSPKSPEPQTPPPPQLLVAETPLFSQPLQPPSPTWQQRQELQESPELSAHVTSASPISPWHIGASNVPVRPQHLRTMLRNVSAKSDFCLGPESCNRSPWPRPSRFPCRGPPCFRLA